MDFNKDSNLIFIFVKIMENRKLKVSEMKRLSPEQYMERPESGLVIVLDNVRSAYNGQCIPPAQMRSEWTKSTCGICPTPLPPKYTKRPSVQKVLAWHTEADILKLVKRLKSDDYTIISVSRLITQ